MVPRINRVRTDAAKEWLTQSINDLKKPVDNVADFVAQTKYLLTINEEFQNYRDKIDLYGNFHSILASDGTKKITKEDKDRQMMASKQIADLSQIVQECESSQEAQNERFKKDLEKLIPKLHGEVATLHEESIDPKFMSESSNMYEMIEDLDKKWVAFKEFETRSETYNQWQETLMTPSTMFDNI